jgi:hypothetical protein
MKILFCYTGISGGYAMGSSTLVHCLESRVFVEQREVFIGFPTQA